MSCKKDDMPPVITISGNNPDSVIAKTDSEYRDAGATASDNEDGNITSQIVIAGNVNIVNVGSYRIYYSAEDDAHNITEKQTRIVEVISAAGSYMGSYDCPGTAPNTVSVTAYSNNDSIQINNLYNTGTVLKAGLNNYKFVMASQTLTTGVEISGSFNPAGTKLYGTFSIVGGSGTTECTATLTRN